VEIRGLLLNKKRKMTTIVKETGFTQEAFDEFLASRQEPEWLTAGRRAAWQAFQDVPIPSRADEEWMRTDIRLFRLDKFHPPSAVPSGHDVISDMPGALLSHGVQVAGSAETYESHPVETARPLQPKWAKQGVLFGSLDALVRQHGDIVRKHLFRAV